MATRKTKQRVTAEEVIDNEIMSEEQDVEPMVEEPVVSTPVPAIEEKKKANKPKHDPDELIVCRSVTFGELILIGPKTGMVYSWSNEGDIREVEYQDLISLKAVRSNYLFKPYFMIEDEDILEEWKNDLEKIYSTIGQIDIAAMFNLPQRQFVSQLKNLPASVKETVQNTAYSMLKNGTLYDIRKINAIDEILGTELKLMI